MESNHMRQGGNTFLLTARHEFIENKKSVLLVVGAIWAVYIMMGALLGYNGRGGGNVEMFMIFFWMTVFGSIVGSLFFSNMKSKQSRISALMLPASASDKFMVRWIAVVPLLFGVLVAGFYFCEFARIATRWLCDYPEMVNGRYMEVINPWTFICSQKEFGGLLLVFLLSAYLFNQSLFIFGSILWPKLSFIKTLVVLWCLQMLIGFVGIFFFRSSLIMGFLNEWDPDGTTVFRIWTTVQLALAALFYFLAYCRFKRSQVVYKLF